MAFKITSQPWIEVASTTIGVPDHIFLTLAIGVCDSNSRNLSISTVLCQWEKTVGRHETYELTALERIRARIGSLSRTASLRRFR